MPHSCRCPRDTALLPNPASTSLPPSNFICPRPESAQGGLGYCPIFPAIHGVPLSSYCITQKETTIALNSTYTRQERKRLEEDYPTTAVLKGHGDNRLAQGYTSSLWQRQELNQNPPSSMLVPLLQAFPLCL